MGWHYDVNCSIDSLDILLCERIDDVYVIMSKLVAHSIE